MQITNLFSHAQTTTGTPFFTPADVERFARFLHNAANDSTAEFFSRRLRAMMNLVKLQYADGLISKARAIDEMLCALECAHREHGYCYQLLKSELGKERAKWTAK